MLGLIGLHENSKIFSDKLRNIVRHCMVWNTIQGKQVSQKSNGLVGCCLAQLKTLWPFRVGVHS